MPRSSSLPAELKYLEPFRKQLAKLEPEEINENMDLSLLNNLFARRITGLSENDAIEALKSDYAALEAWLAVLERQNDSLIFLEAYLSVLAGTPELIRELKAGTTASKTKPRVQMETPKGSRARNLQHGVLKVVSHEEVLFIQPISKDDVEMYTVHFCSSNPTVDIAGVSGFRFHNGANVEHIFQVTGGAVLCLISGPVELEKSRFAPYLRTIRVVQEECC